MLVCYSSVWKVRVVVMLDSHWWQMANVGNKSVNDCVHIGVILLGI